MTLLSDLDERTIEASPARRLRAIDQGHGPRAPWLASAAGGLLSLGLLSVAAAPMAVEARSWLKQSMRIDAAAAAPSMRAALVPALAAVAIVLASTLLGQALAHGGWIRLAPWRRGGRASASQRLRSALAGWLVGACALAGGVAGAVPWLGSLSQLSERPLGQAAWAVGAFVASASLGALLATAMLGFVQVRMAMRAFDRTLRMTHAEARDAARADQPASRRRPVARPRWRLA